MRAHTTSRPTVLFVGHEATRTGAPLMLLYFLRWLREHTDLSFEVLLLDGGPLVDDFAAVAPVIVLSDLRDHWSSRALRAIGLHGVASQLRSVQARWRCAHLRSASTVYCNSVPSLRVLRLLGRRPRTVVAHVHEMHGALGMPGTEGDRNLLQTRADHVVAASDLVARYLVTEHGIDPDKIVRHYEFIDVRAFLDQVPAAPVDVRGHLGLPEDAAVVGAAGVTEARKGPELFLQLALALRRRGGGRPVHLVWVGSTPDTHETRWILHDLEKAGLGDVVHFVGLQVHPASWFAQFDVFVLTSREDPFPLVCLESSLLATPIVCFDNTGMAEFAGDDERGFVVPYLDVEAMADRVEALLADPAARAAVGERASARVRSAHDVSSGAPALWADLEGWMRDG